jgi:uncharacterized protein YuzB (UPF0349 family)
VYAIDVDGDGVPPPGNPDIDVLAASSVAGSIASDDKIILHLNDGVIGDPGFTDNVEISAGAVAPEAIVAVDIDGDGAPPPGNPDIDVLAASAVGNTILWYENDAMVPPSFTEHPVSNDAPGVQGLFWADLNGDPDLDVVAALAGDDSIAWYENLGSGDFGNPDTNRKDVALLTANGAVSVFAIDLDGDTDTDVLSASAFDDKIAWYENLGGGNFGNTGLNQKIISNSADGAQSVFAIDMDNDGDVDVLSASNADDSIRWFESDLVDEPGPDPQGFTEHLITDTARGASDVFAIDMDDDGDVDVLSASSTDNRRWTTRPPAPSPIRQWRRHWIPATTP